VEYGIYICGWAEIADGFEVWVRSRPHVRARGKTQLEAGEALTVAIATAGGAHFAVLEFVPPLPQSEFDKKYSSPELYQVGGDDSFSTNRPRRIPFETDEERTLRWSWYDEFFVAPCCTTCRQPGGPRSERVLVLTDASIKYDAGVVHLTGPSLRVFSENFLALLSKEERQRLQFRLVKRPRRSRKQFFELIGPSGPPQVAVAGREVQGWQCVSCGARCFGHAYSPDISIGDCIARADLPRPLPSVFTIGTQPDVSLCVTAQRWASLVGQPGTRGCLSRLVGVIPDEDLIRNPELPPRKDSLGS